MADERAGTRLGTVDISPRPDRLILPAGAHCPTQSGAEVHRLTNLTRAIADHKHLRSHWCGLPPENEGKLKKSAEFHVYVYKVGDAQVIHGNAFL